MGKRLQVGQPALWQGYVSSIGFGLYAAVVTRVYNDGLADVTVFPPGGTIIGSFSQTRITHDDIGNGLQGFCLVEEFEP